MRAYERALARESALSNLAESYLLEQEEGRLRLTEEEWDALDAVRCGTAFRPDSMDALRLWDTVIEGLETLPSTGIKAFEDLREDLIARQEEHLAEMAYQRGAMEAEKRWEESRDYWERYNSL